MKGEAVYVPMPDDLADAEVIRKVALACEGTAPGRRTTNHPQARGSATHKTIRAAIDWFWDKPRS